MITGHNENSFKFPPPPPRPQKKENSKKALNVDLSTKHYAAF